MRGSLRPNYSALLLHIQADASTYEHTHLPTLDQLVIQHLATLSSSPVFPSNWSSWGLGSFCANLLFTLVSNGKSFIAYVLGVRSYPAGFNNQQSPTVMTHPACLAFSKNSFYIPGIFTAEQVCFPLYNSASDPTTKAGPSQWVWVSY